MDKDAVLHNKKIIPMGTRRMTISMGGASSSQERIKGKRIGRRWNIT
jgi:hypothetical protein